jgi:PEP-CTERM motif-containing protein
MKRLILMSLVLMGMLVMPALAYEELAIGDAMISNGNDTPNGTENQHCVATNPNHEKAMIIEWDLSAYAGWDAVGDATLKLNVGWMQDNPTVVGIYLLTGGDFDEATVTAVNYCTDGLVPNVLGTSVNGLLDTVGNFTYNEITLPQAMMDELLKGTAAGLAVSTGDGTDTWMNACIRTQNTDWTLHAEPTLVFDATPEPATMSLLALGGLALLRRRK